MSIDLARRPEPISDAVEQVIIGGDLSKLTSEQRLKFYVARCEAADLDPRCRPFIYIMLSGKLVLYATKEAAEQLNGKHGISHSLTGLTYDEKSGLIECWVQASMRGRSTVELGVVHAGGLKGPDMANARMKAVTKAKRRATLSLCGLGDVLAEEELDTVADIRRCTPTGQLEPPDNQSGHGRGQYANDNDTASYLEAFDGYVVKRNQEWLDRWSDEHSGEFQGGPNGELINRYQADHHLLKWCTDTGRLDKTSWQEDGMKARLLGRYTAIVYHRTKEDRKALTQELKRYIDQQEQRGLESLQKTNPELFDPQADDVDADAEFEPGGADDGN